MITNLTCPNLTHVCGFLMQTKNGAKKACHCFRTEIVHPRTLGSIKRCSTKLSTIQHQINAIQHQSKTNQHQTETVTFHDTAPK